MLIKHRKALVPVGATLTISPIAVLTYYGNLLPYLASYLQARRDHIHLYLDPLWPTTVFRCCFSFSMIFSSPLEYRFGLRPCILAGILLMDASVLSGFFTVDEPVAFTLVFGAAHGVAVGLIYPLTLKLLLHTMGEKGGTASGIMSIGPAAGSIINIAIAYLVINPENKKADHQIGNSVFFSDPGVIARVPYYFLAIGGLIFLVTLAGFVCMCVGSSDRQQEEVEITATTPGKDQIKASPLDFTDGKLKTCENHHPTQDNSSGASVLPENQQIPEIEAAAPAEEHNRVPEDSLRCAATPDLSPSEMLRTPKFWCLWLCFFSFSHTVYLHLNLYKQYGQLAISSDAVLVTTGLVCTLGMLVTRPMTGVLCDRIGCRNTGLTFTSSAAIFMSLMVAVVHLMPSLYPVLAAIEFQCVASQTLLFSLLTYDLFGKTHCPSNFGLVSSGQPFVSIAEPFVVEALVRSVGWHWIFLSGSFFAVLSVFCIVALDWVK